VAVGYWRRGFYYHRRPEHADCRAIRELPLRRDAGKGNFLGASSHHLRDRAMFRMAARE